jgi:multidrug resistance protein, MATE family
LHDRACRVRRTRYAPPFVPVVSESSRRLHTLVALAWPIVLARATQAVIGFCDALMTAPLGDAALAAVTTGAVNVFTVAILPMGTVFIVQSFAAQLKGRGDLPSARRYAWYGLMLAAATAALAAAASPFIDDLLGLFGYQPEVRDLQARYIAIRFSAVAAIVGTEALGNWFGGLGNTRLQMIAGGLAMAANILLNWLLIEGHWGAPALGVTGAAIASSAASWLGFAFMAWAFASRRIAPRARGPLGLRASELARVLRFGLPNGLNWFLEFAAFAWFINAVMTRLGTVPLAALNVVIQVNAVSFMPAFGVASAGAILVGQAVGRGRRDDVPGIVKTTAAVAVTWMVAVGLSYVLFPGAIMSLFVVDGDPGAPFLLATGTTMLVLSAGWQIFDGLSMTVSEALRATGDTAWCLRARLTLAWAIFAPAAWLLVIHLDGGIHAAMGCLIGYVALLAAAMLWRFRGGAWRRIELVEPEVALQP